MGGIVSNTFQENEIEMKELEMETGFSKDEIQRLYTRFKSLDKSNCGYLTREDFQHIHELAINPLGDRIIESFFHNEAHHTDFSKFIKTIAIFRPLKKTNNKKWEKSEQQLAEDENLPNSRTAKLKFVFELFDFGRDDFIQNEELLAVLHVMIGNNTSKEELNAIVLRALEESDYDRDGKIGWSDFQKALESIDIENKVTVKSLS